MNACERFLFAFFCLTMFVSVLAQSGDDNETTVAPEVTTSGSDPAAIPSQILMTSLVIAAIVRKFL